MRMRWALGPRIRSVAYGEAAPSQEPFARLAASLACTVYLQRPLPLGVPVEILFAGLAPGYAGVYQVDWRVPAAATGFFSVELHARRSGSIFRGRDVGREWLRASPRRAIPLAVVLTKIPICAPPRFSSPYFWLPRPSGLRTPTPDASCSKAGARDATAPTATAENLAPPFAGAWRRAPTNNWSP